MGSVQDLVRVAVIWLVTFVYQNLMIRLAQPGTSLYEAGANAANLGGSTLAPQWFQIAVMWIPLIVYGGTMLFLVVRIYRRQAVTALSGRP
jgi:hypothetical protein